MEGDAFQGEGGAARRRDGAAWAGCGSVRTLFDRRRRVGLRFTEPARFLLSLDNFARGELVQQRSARYGGFLKTLSCRDIEPSIGSYLVGRRALAKPVHRRQIKLRARMAAFSRESQPFHGAL